jgi:hypothetical protein
MHVYPVLHSTIGSCIQVAASTMHALIVYLRPEVPCTHRQPARLSIDLMWSPRRHATDSYNLEVAKYESFLDINAKLLQANIVSVLPEDMMALRDPIFGDLLLTILVVLAHVKTTHGNVTAADLAVMKAALADKLQAALTSTLPPPCSPFYPEVGSVATVWLALSGRVSKKRPRER